MKKKNQMCQREKQYSKKKEVVGSSKKQNNTRFEICKQIKNREKRKQE